MTCVNDLRLEEARKMLANPTCFLLIKEIAAKVGLTDPSDFTHAFKREFGLTPTEYRERFQGGAARGNPAGASQASSFREGITRSLWVSLTPTLLRTFVGG